MTTTQTLYPRARYVANEVTTTITWTNTELDLWCNEGIKAIIKLDPAAYLERRTLSLVPGVSQQLPSDTVILIDVVGNVDSLGTPGRQIRAADRASMDAMYPNWHTETRKTYVRNYMYDAKEPKQFYNYPPVEAGTLVQVVLSTFPADVTYAGGSTIPLEPKYESPLVDYMLFRMFSKDVENAGNDTRAMAYFQQFSGGVANIVSARNGGSQQKE